MLNRFLLFISLFTLTAGCSRNVSCADCPRVNAEKAMAYAVQNASIVPRHPGSDGLRQSMEQIRKTAEALFPGKVSVMEFQEQTPAGIQTFRNIVVDLPGKSDEFVIAGAHYDTKYFPEPLQFQGANDGASGVAALLAMMEAIRDAKVAPPVGIRFVFFDGEECRFSYAPHDGFHGSRHAAAVWKKDGSLKRCKAMILLDMIGDRDLQITLSDDTPDSLFRIAGKSASSLGKPNLITSFGSTILDDHTAFTKEGVPAIDLIDFHYGLSNCYWHTEQDTTDKISGESIADAANLALVMIWNISREDHL